MYKVIHQNRKYALGGVFVQYEYYYSKLQPVEKKIYRILYNAVKEYKQEVCFTFIPNLNLGKIIRSIECDHPELYYWNCHNIQFLTNIIKITVQLKYYLKYTDVLQNTSKIEHSIESILSKCKNNKKSDVFFTIYECMAKNISYDFTRMNSKKSADMLIAHTIYGVFAKQKAVCDGISKAFKYVLERSGIDCIVVLGRKVPDGEPHAWNIVWINDEPCHVDLTWAVENSNKRIINYDYVGLTDKQIEKDHIIDTELIVPKCNDENNDYYIKNNAAMKSIHDLQLYLQANAGTKPFEVNVRLDFPCKIEDVAKKSVDYIVKHYILNGQHVKIDVQYREGQNTLMLIGK